MVKTIEDNFDNRMEDTNKLIAKTAKKFLDIQDKHDNMDIFDEDHINHFIKHLADEIRQQNN